MDEEEESYDELEEDEPLTYEGVYSDDDEESYDELEEDEPLTYEGVYSDDDEDDLDRLANEAWQREYEGINRDEAAADDPFQVGRFRELGALRDAGEIDDNEYTRRLNDLALERFGRPTDDDGSLDIEAAYPPEPRSVEPPTTEMVDQSFRYRPESDEELRQRIEDLEREARFQRITKGEYGLEYPVDRPNEFDYQVRPDQIGDGRTGFPIDDVPREPSLNWQEVSLPTPPPSRGDVGPKYPPLPPGDFSPQLPPLPRGDLPPQIQAPPIIDTDVEYIRLPQGTRVPILRRPRRLTD